MGQPVEQRAGEALGAEGLGPLVEGQVAGDQGVRSDNGPEFITKAVRESIAVVGARTAFIEPASPWENGYCESCNSKLRDELLNGELFHSLAEARIVIERCRQHYNTQRPHSSLGYKPPAPQALLWPGGPSNLAAKPTMH